MSSQASKAASDQVTSGRPASGAVILSKPMRRLPPAATISPEARGIRVFMGICISLKTENGKRKTEILCAIKRWVRLGSQCRQGSIGRDAHALGRSAKLQLSEMRERRVGVVTNDQGGLLVDAAVFHPGFPRPTHRLA